MIHITTGTICVRTSNLDNTPIAHASVRVYKMQGSRVSFETYYTTNTDGMTIDIKLEAPDSRLSLQKDAMDKPYSSYNVEVKKDGYDIEQRLGVQIFAAMSSELIVVMNPIRSTSSKQNVMVIDEHSLFENLGDQDA